MQVATVTIHKSYMRLKRYGRELHAGKYVVASPFTTRELRRVVKTISPPAIDARRAETEGLGVIGSGSITYCVQ